MHYTDVIIVNNHIIVLHANIIFMSEGYENLMEQLSQEDINKCTQFKVVYSSQSTQTEI